MVYIYLESLLPGPFWFTLTCGPKGQKITLDLIKPNILYGP